MDYKTQEEYLLLLAKHLRFLPREEASKILKIYQDKINVRIDYGEKVIDILESLPDPEEVAKNAYDSRGFKYRELMQKRDKTLSIISIIVNILLMLLSICLFASCIVILISSFVNSLKLIPNILSLNTITNTLVTSTALLLYYLVIVSILIYVIDLFIFLETYFLIKIKIIKTENTIDRIMKFSLSSKIDNLSKKKHFLRNSLIAFSVSLCIVIVISVSMKGYLYYSFTNKTMYSKSYDITTSSDELYIEANNANIHIYQSDDEYIHYHYNYTFFREPNISINDDLIKIGLQDTVRYDLLNLFKEPTESLEIYLPTNYSSTSIILNNGSVSIDNTKISSFSLESNSNTSISILSSNISNAKFNGILSDIALDNSSFTNVDYSLDDGKFSVNESTIENLIVFNKRGLHTLTSSSINNVNYTKTSGDLIFESISSSGQFNINNKSCKTSFLGSTLFSLSADLIDNALLDLTKVIICDKASINLDYSYFTIDNVVANKVDIVKSVASSIYINYINTKIDGDSSFVNNYNELASTYKCFINISNEGTKSKTEINESNIQELNLLQNKGYILIVDSTINDSNIESYEVGVIDIKNNDGSVMKFKLLRIKNYIEINNEKDTSIKYEIYDYDEISYASVIAKNKAKDKVTFTMGEKHE